MIAAHAHWGIRGGFIIINLYMNTELGLEGENLGILWRAVEYAATLNQLGYDWVIMGDFNMDVESLHTNSLIQSVHGRHIASTTIFQVNGHRVASTSVSFLAVSYRIYFKELKLIHILKL